MRFRASSDALAAGLLFIAIGALAGLAPTQSDTWWLLRAGQDIWRTHSIPVVDAYSHTARGLYWPNHEWLTEAVFYPLFRLGGLPLVTALCAGLIVSAWTVSWRLCEPLFEVRFLPFAVSLASASAAWAVRPQAFTMLAFVVTCWLLVSRRYFWLPLLMLVWANLHGAVALGLVAVAAAAVASLVSERRVPWTLGVVGLLCFAATCLTPLGLRLWTFIPESMARSSVNKLIEWQPPDFSVFNWPFWMLAIAVPLAAIWWRRKLDHRTLTMVVIAIAVLPLAARAMRNVAIYLLVAVPALTALAAPRPARPPRALRGERERVNAALLLICGLAAAAIVISLWRLPSRKLGWEPISARAVEAIDRCDGPLYNTYGDGGVLIWFTPRKPVFIDNRQDPYPMDLLRANHALEFDAKYESVFAQYGITCAAVTPGSPLERRLRQDAAWSATFADSQWAVFAKATR